MEPLQDDYAGWASHYDLHGFDWYTRTYGQRMLSSLRERGFPSGRILDVGCGTGTLAIYLARHGYEVTGVDLSPGMLAIAREKDNQGSVVWEVADLKHMNLGRTFDVIVSVGETLNHLQSIDDWGTAFNTFAAHLRPNGQLFLEVATLRGLQRQSRSNFMESDGRTLYYSVIYDSIRRCAVARVVSFVERQPLGTIEKASKTTVEWAYPVSDISTKLSSAGFVKWEPLWTEADDLELSNQITILASMAPAGTQQDGGGSPSTTS